MDRIARNPAANDERGQTMTEYTIVLGVISLGILIALGALNTAIGAAIDTVVALIP
jgi:Flp pilus assembly pilin Flp